MQITSHVVKQLKPHDHKFHKAIAQCPVPPHPRTAPPQIKTRGPPNHPAQIVGNETQSANTIKQEKYFSPKYFSVEMDARRIFPDLLFEIILKFLYESKPSGLQLSFNIFRQPLPWYVIKINFRQFSENTLNFDFLEKGLEQLLLNILCMIFQGNCFLCHILPTDQI